MDSKDYVQNVSYQYCFPDNNSSCRKEVNASSGSLLLYFVLSCVSVFTVFLNLLVIISISHFKQLHIPTNLLILSLAVADLFVGLIVMPLNIMQLIDTCWYFGKSLCSMYQLINFFSTAESLCNLVFIAVDRYIAINDPLLYTSRVTVCRTSMCIILGWTCSILYVTILLYFNDHLLPSQMSIRCYGECVLVINNSWVIIDLVVSFVAPCSVILIVYSIIFNVARRQARAVRAVMNDVSQNNRAKLSGSTETKAAKKLSVLIFIYLASWIPYYINCLTVDSISSFSVLWNMFGWLVYLNSSVNPLIYAIFYPWFRASVKYIVTFRIFKSSSSRLKLLPEHF